MEQKTDEKMEEMKQKNQEQQPQAAETQAAQGQQPAQEGQAQAKPEKPNLIADSDVDWKELEQFGVKRENLSEKDMKALMNYGKTRLVTVNRCWAENATSCKPDSRCRKRKMES